MPKHQLSVVLENSAHCFRSHRITGQLHTLRIKPLFKNVIYRLTGFLTVTILSCERLMQRLCAFFPDFLPCPLPEKPAFGKYTALGNISISQPLSRLHYACNSGYVLRGKDTVLCTLGGKWSAPAPVCRRKHCKTVLGLAASASYLTLL